MIVAQGTRLREGFPKIEDEDDIFFTKKKLGT